MPVVDYSNYAANQSEWAHSLLRKAKGADYRTAAELGEQASDALKRVIKYIRAKNGRVVE